MWFEALTGFREQSAEQVRSNLALSGETLTSRVNGRVMRCGRLETPTVAELRDRVTAVDTPRGTLRLREVVGDVQRLHTDPANARALFQVASQFNLLEMVSPSVTPDAGIDIYERDRTQGPACAIACGAGTISRNYFIEIDGQPGQTADRQIDCLRNLGAALGNENQRLWTMQNGYALATEEGLREIAAKLAAMSEPERDALRQLLRVGLQWDTEVTLNDAGHDVSQVYGSALPVAYSRHPASFWSPFAQLILEASYEAAFLTALLNASRTGSNRLYLTLLGGGAFGNAESWIMAAIRRSLNRFADRNLDVAIVSYGSSNPAVRALVAESEKSV